MRLAHKVALVTGAGSGIGRGISLRLGGEGARVVVADFDAARGQATEGLLTAHGVQGVFVRTDVTQTMDVRRSVETTLRRFGRLDILVNSAGISPMGSVTDIGEDEWDACIDIDLKSVFLACKYAIPSMTSAGGGSIINIAGTLGLLAGPRKAAYCAAKAGVINLTRQMAIDYGPRVRVNCICPGFVDTPLNAAVPQVERQRMFERLPLRRAGQADDIANAALYLASDESSYVTGACIIVDGGQTLSISSRSPVDENTA